MYALLLILSLASGVLPRNSPPELGGVPFARFSANGGVVPQETTPSAPASVASRHFLDGAATPPNSGGELQTDFQYDVLRSKPLQKDEPGQLRINEAGIEYRSVNEKTSLLLPFIDVHEMDLSDPSVIRIETYEMLKRKLSGRRSYVFRLRSSRGVQDNERLVKFVSDRLPRPVVASYSTSAKPEFEIPAYHRHVLSGCDGRIQITTEGIRYLSSKEDHSRTWRYSEIQAIGGSDPFSFRVTTLAETFTFDLKERLPKEAYDLVWQRVYELPPIYGAGTPVPNQESKP